MDAQRGRVSPDHPDKARVDKIKEKLYYDGRFFSIEEVELILFGADLDDVLRKKIMYNYMTRMQSLKNRGVKWLEKIIELAAALDEEADVRYYTEMLEKIRKAEEWQREREEKKKRRV